MNDEASIPKVVADKFIPEGRGYLFTSSALDLVQPRPEQAAKLTLENLQAIVDEVTRPRPQPAFVVHPRTFEYYVAQGIIDREGRIIGMMPRQHGRTSPLTDG